MDAGEQVVASDAATLLERGHFSSFRAVLIARGVCAWRRV